MSIHKQTALTAPAYSNGRVQIDRLTPVIGAEIKGVDLSRDLDDETFAIIDDAFIKYQVIFFRDQRLTSEQHRNFSLRFGTPAYSRKVKMYDGYEDVGLLENDGSKVAIGALWHSDNTDYIKPPMASLLYSEISPAVGGDTIWASMYAAYEALSEPMQAYLQQFEALHDNTLIKQIHAADNSLRSEGMVVEKAVAHPIVTTHPVSGRKALFVNSAYTHAIIGVPPNEGRHILNMLFEHIMRPEFHVRFRWTAGSLAIWDNRCTQHYALDDYSELRRMRRVQLVGQEPA